jgi:hypothetical protein
MNSNYRYAYVNGIVGLAIGLSMLSRGPVAIGGKMNPSDSLLFKKKSWMDIWELNPEGM